MSARDTLFANFSPDELEFIVNSDFRSIPAYSMLEQENMARFFNLMQLVNLAKSIAKLPSSHQQAQIEKFGHQLFSHLPFESPLRVKMEDLCKPKYKSDRLNHTIVAIPNTEKVLDIEKVVLLYDELTKQLNESIEECENALKGVSQDPLSQNPYRLYYQLQRNLLKSIKDSYLNELKQCVEKKDEFKIVDKYCALNLAKRTLEWKDQYTRGEKWGDLEDAEYYFNKNLLEHARSVVGSLPFVKNSAQMIQEFKEREEAILPLTSPLLQRLKILIDQYHKIEKSNPKNIDQRRRQLKKIAELSKQAEAELGLTPAQIRLLQSIANQAEMKSKYLQEVSLIPAKTEKRVFRLEHTDGIPLVTDKIEAITDLDPLHRNGLESELFALWLNEAEINPDMPNFWLWMEGLKDVTLLKMVSLQNTDPRYQIPKAQKLVEFKDGICFNKLCSEREDGKVADGAYLYNIDKENNLYILPTPPGFKGGISPFAEELAGKGIKHPSVLYNHNSVLGGENVKSVGCIYFKDGKIVQMDTDSGHYQPALRNLKNGIMDALLSKNVFHPQAIVTDFNYTNILSVDRFVKMSFADIKRCFGSERKRGLPLTELKKIRAKALAVEKAIELKKAKASGEDASSPETKGPKKKK